MKKLIEIFTDIGLTSQESQVYLSVLQHGASIPTDIARNCGLKRTSVNNYISSLLQKGFLQKNISGKRLSYIAESPENIFKDLERKRQHFLDKLPQMNHMFTNASHKANIRYFEWKKGISDIYREISTWFLPIVSFYSLDRYLELFKTMDVMDEFIANIRANENTIHDLMEDSKKSRNIMRYRSSQGKQWKYLPTTFRLTIDMMIQWDTIAIISFTSQMGIIIENQGIADFHRNVFEHFWELLG